ncbi:hypothetical protein D3C78_1427150 [compost metagenome]
MAGKLGLAGPVALTGQIVCKLQGLFIVWLKAQLQGCFAVCGSEVRPLVQAQPGVDVVVLVNFDRTDMRFELLAQGGVEGAGEFLGRVENVVVLVAQQGKAPAVTGDQHRGDLLLILVVGMQGGGDAARQLADQGQKAAGQQHSLERIHPCIPVSRNVVWRPFIRCVARLLCRLARRSTSA